MTLTKGDYVTVNDTRAKIVGFRKAVKGDIFLYSIGTKYAVFVEQSGDYRMGTTRFNNVKAV